MADETLEWDLKVDADTGGATKMDQVLGKLDLTMNLLQFHLQHIEENTRKVNKKHEEHEKHAKGLMGVLNRLVEKGMEPFLHKAKEIAEFEFIREGTEKLLELPRELAHEVYELGEEMLMAAGKEERMGIAFRNALGSEEAEKLEGYMDRVRKHTEFTKDEMEMMNLELAKAGFKGENLGRAFEATIDLASMSANPQQGMNSALSALQRLMITGRLESRALVPFGISEKDLFGEMTRETGLSMKALKKQMEQGKLDIDTALNSLYVTITNKTGKALGGAGADMEKTFLTRLKNLKQIPDLLSERLAGTKGYSAISDFVGRLADAFDPNSESGQRIVTGLTNIVDTIGEQLEGINVGEIAENVSSAMTTIANAIGPVVTAIKALYHAAESAFGVFEKLVNYSPTGLIANAIVEHQVGKQYAQKGERFDPNFNLAAAQAEIRRRRAAGTFNTANDNFAEGMAKNRAAFEAVGGLFGVSIERGLRKQTKTHSPSEVFRQVGADLAAGVAGGVEDGAARVDAAFSRMMQPATVAGAASAGAGNGGPPVQVTLQPTIRIDGAGLDADQIADAVEEKLTEIVPGALQSAIEQVAMQTGSAA